MTSEVNKNNYAEAINTFNKQNIIFTLALIPVECSICKGTHELYTTYEEGAEKTYICYGCCASIKGLTVV